LEKSCGTYKASYFIPAVRYLKYIRRFKERDQTTVCCAPSAGDSAWGMQKSHATKQCLL